MLKLNKLNIYKASETKPGTSKQPKKVCKYKYLIKRSTFSDEEYFKSFYWIILTEINENKQFKDVI